jgi:RNA polymerase sigma-70 factor (ECF subfamily)
VRLLYRMLRKDQRETPTEEPLLSALSEADGAADPELKLLKEHYGSEFHASLEEAWHTLEPRERNIIRQHHLDQLTIDQLAVVYRVNRATAMRWLAKARDQLYLETRIALARRLGVARTELGSILDLIRSRMADSPLDLRKTAK